MKNKRGLSTVVVTLLIILISLVAVGIVWVVVRNVLKSGTEQVSSGLGQIFISLELQNVNMKSNGDVEVSVKRNVGAGDLTGINFIVSDGVNTKVIKKDTTLSELDTNAFTITSSELGSNFGLIKEISIAPIIGSNIGNVIDKKTYSTSDVLKNLGAISWWKLDGDGKDDIGTTPLTTYNLVTWEDGKYGKSMEMADTANPGCIDQNAGLYTNSLTDTIKNLPKGSFTISWWNNLPSNLGATRVHLAAISVPGCGYCSIWNELNYIWIRTAAGASADISYTAPSINAWHHFVYYFDYPNRKTGLYIDGSLISEKTLPDGDYGTIQWIAFGVYYPWCVDSIPGEKIDDVILFNKILSANQIKYLYNFDTTE